MDEQKQALIQRLEREIEERQKRMMEVAVLPDGLPGHLWDGSSWFYLDVPWSRKHLAEARRILGKDWEFRHENDANTEVLRYYEHKSGVRLVVRLCAKLEGSACEVIQVGTKTEEFPVYEVRCKDV